MFIPNANKVFVNIVVLYKFQHFYLFENQKIEMIFINITILSIPRCWKIVFHKILMNHLNENENFL